MCHDREHNDKIDVAHCFVTDQTRLIIWGDENQSNKEVLLSPDETLHLIYLLSGVITKVTI
jgi:hypothetical protein